MIVSVSLLDTAHQSNCELSLGAGCCCSCCCCATFVF